MLSFGPHEKENGTIQWQTAFLPYQFYEEKNDEGEISIDWLQKTSYTPTLEERESLKAEIQKWEQEIPQWPLVSQFVEENPLYNIDLDADGLRTNGEVKSNVYSIENDFVKELEVIYDYEKEEFTYGYACYTLLGSTIVIEKSNVYDMADIENQECLEFSERPPRQHSGPPNNEESFKRESILELVHQKLLDDPLVFQFMEENPRYNINVDFGTLWNYGIKQGTVYSFENNFIKEFKITLENDPEKSVYMYMCYNPGENEWGEKFRVYYMEDIQKQKCYEMAPDSTHISSELPNLDGSVKTEEEILMSKQVILDDPLVSQFIEDNPKHNMVLHKGIFDEEGRVQYEIFAWEDDLIKKLEIIHQDNSGELVYVYICYTPGENVGHNKYRVYDMEDIEKQKCYVTHT